MRITSGLLALRPILTFGLRKVFKQTTTQILYTRKLSLFSSTVHSVRNMCRCVPNMPSSSTPVPRVQLPREAIPLNYNITIVPDFINWTYKGKVEIMMVASKTSNSVTLNSLDIIVIKAVIERQNSNDIVSENPCYDQNEQTVSLFFPGPKFIPGEKLKLLIDYTGIINDKMSGFYRSSYKDINGVEKSIAVTQFEPVDCRRAVPSFDEPDLKATFELTMIVDKKLTALSNCEVLSDDIFTENSEKRLVKFAKTPIMSTYLLAFAVGEFEFIEAFTKKSDYLPNPIRCRVYTTPGLANQGKFALDVAVRTLEFFSEIFDIPYPLKKCDQLAVPDFSAGAMENWGLITYRTVSLLVDDCEGSVQSKKWIATTVTHELAHQWFGNLVTFEFWDELWLNEGFATWVGTYGAAKLFPEWDLWTLFISEDQNRAMIADSLRSSHPIQVPVSDAKDITQIFDGISYSKGASVIQMLTNWIGIDVFMKGIRIYLKRYEYKNATTDNLWQCLSQASGLDVAHFMTLWTKEIGYPVISVTEGEYNNEKNLNLSLQQNRFLQTGDVGPIDDLTIWNIPLNLAILPVDGTSVEIDHSIMDKRRTEVKIAAHFGIPVYLLNYDRTAFYRVAYEDKTLVRMAEAIYNKRLSLHDCIGVYNDSFALARGGYKSLTGFLTLLRKAAPRDDMYSLFVEISLALATVRNVWAGQDMKVRSQLNKLRLETFAPHVARIGFDKIPGESSQQRMLRPIVISNAGQAGYQPVISEAQRRFKDFTEGSTAITSDLYRSVFEICIVNGGVKEFEKIVGLYQNASNLDLRYAALGSLGSSKKMENIIRALDYSISEAVRPQDIHYVWRTLGANSEARALLWEFFKKNYNFLSKRYEGNFDLFGSCVSMATSSFTSRQELEEMKQFFENKDKSTFVRNLNQSYDEIQSNVSWLERDTMKVAAWLNENIGFVE